MYRVIKTRSIPAVMVARPSSLFAIAEWIAVVNRCMQGVSLEKRYAH